MRLLIFPLTLIAIATGLSWIFSDRLVFPEDYDAVVSWLRSHGRYAWLVGGGVILGDALLPLPSTPAMFAMGIIYGPFWGGLICATATILSALLGYGAILALGRRAAIFIVGEKDLARTEAFYDRWGLLAVIFGRAIGGFAEWAVIFAALSSMPFRLVLAGICIGGLTAGWVVATLGALSVVQPVLAIASTIALLAGLLALSHWMSRESRSDSAE